MIVGAAHVSEAVGRWSPGDICFFERLEFVVREGTLKLTSLLQRRDRKAWPDLDDSFTRIRLSFVGVRSLKLDLSNTGRAQVSGFDIQDVADKQWEDIRYEVLDYEGGVIGLLCLDVSVTVLERNVVLTEEP